MEIIVTNRFPPHKSKYQTRIMWKRIEIKVPASSANMGPGFDVLGIGLGLHLTIVAKVPQPTTNNVGDLNSLNMTIEYNEPGLGVASNVPSDPFENLITRIAIYVASAHDTRLPSGIRVEIHNPIPLGRGLGSSGSAVVAGVALANACCGLSLTKDRMLDFCAMLEGHPDNVAGSLIGGLVTSFLSEDVSLQSQRLSEDRSCIVHSGGSNSIPTPPQKLCVYTQVPLASTIRAVVAIPAFELATSKSRGVLPKSYSRPDVVFNLQRVAMLVLALGDPNSLSPQTIRECMRDKVHQEYRKHLVPGLDEILSLDDTNLPGLLGVCLSGAGPTAIALATSGFDAIGSEMVRIFAKNTDPVTGNPIISRYLVLDVDHNGLEISETMVDE